MKTVFNARSTALRGFVIATAVVLTSALSTAQPAGAPTAKTAPNEAAIIGFGGYAGLMRINLDLVARLKLNPLIGSLFTETDAERLAGLLSDQFCELLGGGCKYEGGDMKGVHQGMGIKTHHFNALAEELQRSMDSASISQAEQFRLIAKLAPMLRDMIEAKTP